MNASVPAGYNVWLVATVGSYQTSKYYARYRDTSKSYAWTKISLKELKVNYPVDMQQTPDIIINLYTETAMGGESRFAYIRIPVSQCQHKESKPQWYRLRSPENERQCPGIILMNVQYVNENSDQERFAKQKSVDGSFRFWA